jgi:hypothetical protein
MARVRGLRTDAVTRTRLGPALLAELRANLWAVDCQTCDRPLGRRKPSLTVADNGGLAEVALHHRRCQAPRWEYAAWLPRFGVHQSWRTGGFVAPDRDLAVVLVNPACEVAALVTTGNGWRLANLDAYLLAGMTLGWPGRPTPLPGLTGSFDGRALTVHLDVGETPIGSWTTGTMPADTAAKLRGRDAVLVGVTTATDVTTGGDPELLESLIGRREVALAWATLTTTV